MQLLNWWTGNNTADDCIGTAHLTWDGTPEYMDGAFKLVAGGGVSRNKLVFPNFPIGKGIPWSFDGEIFAENMYAFPHICTPESGMGQDASHGLMLLFDFMEGFFQVNTNGAGHGYAQWVYGLYPTTYQNWHTWKIEYDGDVTWTLTINNVIINQSASIGPFSALNGLLAAPYLTIVNWADFGDSYVLIRNLKYSA